MTPLQTLRALGSGEEAPVEAKERVYSSVLAALDAAALVAAGSLTLPKSDASLPPAPLPSAVLTTVSAKTLAVAAGIWLIGGVTGAALYSALRPTREHVIYVDRPVLSAPVATAVGSTGSASGESAPPVALSPLSVQTRPSAGTQALPGAASDSSSQLARERALLDVARADAARGEPALALEHATQHGRQFPNGHLAEERDALIVRALSALGRIPEARRRAQAFHAAYPHSFLTSAIDSEIATP
jgi:hypothetical protein